MGATSFYSLIEETVGNLAGSSFHDNYNGFLIRPLNNNFPGQSEYEALRKGRFAFIQ